MKQLELIPRRRVVEIPKDPASHTCHVPGCSVTVPPRHLMCPSHWRKVPKDLQARVLETFNPAQCRQRGKRPRPSTEWMKAARAAIKAVTQGEPNGTKQ